MCLLGVYTVRFCLNQLRKIDPLTGEKPPFVTLAIDMGTIAFI